MEPEISCRQTRELLDSDAAPLFLDCREQSEYDHVRIAEATLLPMSEISTRLGELAGREGEHIVVHCHHGGRSAQVAMWLRGQGFANAQSMAGGIDEWAVEIEPGMVRY
jgi:rhodanese-related sulfurtransferase